MEPPKHLCQSCHCLVNEDAKFCAICGQKKILKPLSFKELIGDFFSNLFSLDSKFFRTFGRLIFCPGNLTKEYVAGRRQLYYTPIRLFLFWLTVAFVLLNFVLSDSQDWSNKIDKNIQIETYKDSLRTQLDLTFVDSSSQQLLDSLLPQNNIFKNMESSFFSLKFEDSISIKDLYLLSPDEIIKKYDIKDFWRQQFICQMAKATKNPGDFQMYLLSHLSWVILVSIPLIALILKLLYIRRKKLYIEHFVYTLHFHTFLFIGCSVLFMFLLMPSGIDNIVSLILGTLIAIGLYLILSLKTVYQQSLLKTSFKIILFFLFYPLVIGVALIIFILTNFFAF
jgi:hypothetical protein